MNEKKSDKDRDEITDKITSKGAGWLGSQWTKEPERPTYMPPPPPPGAEQSPPLGGLSLETYGEGGSVDRMRRIDPSSAYGLRLRFGRAF